MNTSLPALLRTFWRIVCILSTCVCFSGCIFLQERQPVLIEKNTDLNVWRARGKFSYQSSDASESGNFDWRQDNDAYEVRLFGPLGLGTVKLSGHPHFVQLSRGKDTIESSYPRQLLFDTTGMDIPIEYLAKWMTGQTATNGKATHLVYDPQQVQGPRNQSQLKQFSESGWLIHYSEYQSIPIANPSVLADHSSFYLPSKITLEKGDIKIQLVTRSWYF